MISKNEIKILTDLVERCSDELGNNGCNDFDLSGYLSKKEINQLVKEYCKWTGDPGSFDPEEDNKYFMADFALLDFLFEKVLKELK